MFNDISEIFTSIERVSGNGLRLVMNPDDYELKRESFVADIFI